MHVFKGILVRQKKAVAVFPRPTAGPLRPVVHSQTLKYNSKIRSGQGFTLEELKAAGISKKLAPTIGIAVDHRRKNRCLESLEVNVAHLNTYREKLVVLSRRSRNSKLGDSSPEDLASVTQVLGSVLPIVKPRPTVEFIPVTDELKAAKGYQKLCLERMNVRFVGIHKKKAEATEKEDKK
ncbi:unnamed protein product [Sphagnum jensenii]|uniref:60S ribosomal protein L13 n=1 Tax=Sphagnum jensenii TaxID=128206 RepID=A0ABP0WNW9_9BRYO